ncbi:MAG: hypothetical protein J7K82_06100, partial [Thermoproteales archaeon]|nr:hypothetical protein [Thermoproteales archaeon]
NPKRQYDEYVRSRFKVVKVVHGGGGIAPSRRSISCMVWNGFIVSGIAKRFREMEKRRGCYT